MDFEKLVMAHKSTIYSVCFMYADSKDDADDLFQEVLVALWKGIDSFRGDANVRSWIYRVSMNTCISYKRKKRVKTVELDFSPDLADSGSPRMKQASQLRERIAKLDPFDRAIVLLWLENLPYDEIAAIVGISTRAVAVRLVRIKDKLKNL